jgi:hypothetical protein
MECVRQTEARTLLSLISHQISIYGDSQRDAASRARLLTLTVAARPTPAAIEKRRRRERSHCSPRCLQKSDPVLVAVLVIGCKSLARAVARPVFVYPSGESAVPLPHPAPDMDALRFRDGQREITAFTA